LNYGSGVKVLLFLKGGIGDVVFALPLIADLRRAYPKATLCALTHDQGADVLSLCPALDRVFRLGSMREGWRVADALAALDGPFDVALTPTRSPRAGYLLWRTGARTRVGFATGLERLFFTHRADGGFEVVFSRRFQRLAQALGIDRGESAAPLRVPLPEQEAARARLQGRGWDGRRPLVSIHIGGGWPTKRWPEAHAAALAQRLSADGEQPLLIGGAEDLERGGRIARESGALLSAGGPVRAVLAELSLCQASVGVDSGLSHGSSALGVPTLQLFGPNDPRSVIPAPHQELRSLGLPCQPCNRRGKKACPLGHHACLRDLLPEEVHRSLSRLRARAAAGGGGPA
jgi:ADP-heptose:LPS heptosyltransferase